jgi:UDP-N-acetylglucosamine--N-acetylmuramyl-(pentapeptide) pyrophosphoryl-undecaprenol N-acetylglucosamine transferase
MREAYEWSDVVICRGGALTVSELIKVRRSAFIIPIPNSIDNHQILNAKFFEERGFGKVFEQDSDTNNLISSLRESILDNTSAKSYYEQLNKNSFINSSKIIIDNLNI